MKIGTLLHSGVLSDMSLEIFTNVLQNEAHVTCPEKHSARSLS